MLVLHMKRKNWLPPETGATHPECPLSVMKQKPKCSGKVKSRIRNWPSSTRPEITYMTCPKNTSPTETMRFMGLAVILNFLLKSNRFVPIDEVETSIHYELLAYFLKVFWLTAKVRPRAADHARHQSSQWRLHPPWHDMVHRTKTNSAKQR